MFEQNGEEVRTPYTYTSLFFADYYMRSKPTIQEKKKMKAGSAAAITTRATKLLPRGSVLSKSFHTQNCGIRHWSLSDQTNQQHQYQLQNPQQRKLSSTFSYKNNPFRILGIPDGSSFDQVKQTFVQLALKKHPDVQGGSAKDFMEIRSAFETIVESQKRKPNDVDSDTESIYTNVERTADSIRYTGNFTYGDDFDPNDWQSWFHQRTGMNLAFEMTESTRREMIRVHNTMAPGGKDKGGYWELARQLAEHEDIKDRKSSRRQPSSSLLLSSSTTTESTVLKRRRRRT